MGCASSKEKRCRHCQAPYNSPVPRSYSMHVVHPPQQRGDTFHVVALTSTTLGSLSLNTATTTTTNNNNNNNKHIPGMDISVVHGNVDVRNHMVDRDHLRDDEPKAAEWKEVKKECIRNENSNQEEFLLGLIEAKTWSNMIEGKIPKKKVPKTPIVTPPGEPEMINTWEIMEGLEDVSPLNLPHRFRSFSFDISRDNCINNGGNSVLESPKLISNKLDKNDGSNTIRPIWLQLVEEDANPNCPEFDPEVLSTFKRSLEELSPNHPFHLKTKLEEKEVDNDVGNVVSHKQGKEKVVIYFTSLRGVRKTYEDCCNARVILKGLGIKLDERDVSMHSGFKEELRELLGEGYLIKPGWLPRVFVGRKYIGGAEEIKKMHEEGQLERVVQGCEMVDDSSRGDGGGGGVCEACGDIRFVPCETCSGSCKVYYEADEDEEEEKLEGEDSSEFGFQRCPDCNENGLIRCPICCD